MPSRTARLNPGPLGVSEDRCMNGQNELRAARAKLLPAGVAGWFAYLVVDFLAHAVILAQWWRATESYWLLPSELLRRIPLGYASFAIYCAVLAWLLRRLYGDRLNLSSGLRFGAVAGLVSGLGSVLGTYSAFRMPASALVVWPASVLLDSTIAGGVMSWVLVAGRPWRRVGLVIIAAVVLFIVGVIIQNIFFPTPTDTRRRHSPPKTTPATNSLLTFVCKIKCVV